MGRYKPGTIGDTSARLIKREARRRREAGRQSGSRIYQTTEKVRGMEAFDREVLGLISDAQSTADAALAAAGAVATEQSPGIVRPDGTTVTVDADGTIHAAGGGSADPAEIRKMVDEAVEERISSMRFSIGDDGHLVWEDGS